MYTDTNMIIMTAISNEEESLLYILRHEHWFPLDIVQLVFDYAFPMNDGGQYAYENGIPNKFYENIVGIFGNYTSLQRNITFNF